MRAARLILAGVAVCALLGAFGALVMAAASRPEPDLGQPVRINPSGQPPSTTSSTPDDSRTGVPRATKSPSRAGDDDGYDDGPDDDGPDNDGPDNDVDDLHDD